MTETADKYADLAKTAGASAGLTQEQIPGLAHILRELARSERAEQKEACARVADEFGKQARRRAEKADTHWSLYTASGGISAAHSIADMIRKLEL